MICPRCRNEGRVWPTGVDAESEAGMLSRPCPDCEECRTCRGWGKVPFRSETTMCRRCDGSGRIRRRSMVRRLIDAVFG